MTSKVKLQKESEVKTTIRIISTMLPTIVILILAFILFPYTKELTKSQIDLLSLTPYAIFLIGAILSIHFNRSRVFFTILILTLSLFANRYYQDKQDIKLFFSILCIIIPINFVILVFYKERGIFSVWGIIRIGFIISQFAIANWVLHSEYRDYITIIYKNFIPMKENVLKTIVKSILKILPGGTSFSTTISQVSIIAFIIAFIILLIHIIKNRYIQEVVYIELLLVLLYLIYTNENLVMNYLCFIAFGICLIITIIQDTYSMAFFDELTGLPSRRALRQDMMKLGMRYSIAMLDIDFFKKFNDTYGHDTGDEVLKLVASMIKNVSGGGKSYRYGGEEFTILFPGKNKNDVIIYLDELRERIGKKGYVLPPKNSGSKKSRNNSSGKVNSNRKKSYKKGNNRNKSKHKTNNRRGSKLRSSRITAKVIYITVSIGVSQRDESYKTPDTVLKAADTALYRAKKKGRNCVSK
jgi:diguanylate cyclase (GGDEF)-like protein